MKITPSTVLDAPLYYTGIENHRNTEKCIILRDIEAENDSITLESNLKLIPSNTSIIDLTNNQFQLLPPFHNNTYCETLLLSRNVISFLDCDELPKNIKNLQLSFNKISDLSHIVRPERCPRSLVNLTLKGNDVCFSQDYRIHVIATFPHLKILDFKKISDEERKESTLVDLSLFQEAVDESDMRDLNGDKAVDLMKTVVSKLDETTRKQLQEELANATTLDEIDRLEKILSGGV